MYNIPDSSKVSCSADRGLAQQHWYCNNTYINNFYYIHNPKRSKISAMRKYLTRGHKVINFICLL